MRAWLAGAVAVGLSFAVPMFSQVADRHVTVTLPATGSQFSYSKDGRTLFVIDDGGASRSYDASTGALLHVVEFSKGMSIFALSDDGRTALAGEVTGSLDEIKSAFLMSTGARREARTLLTG